MLVNTNLIHQAASCAKDKLQTVSAVINPMELAKFVF